MTTDERPDLLEILDQYERQAPADVLSGTSAMNGLQHFEESPFGHRLAELVAADKAAGVPDEPDERIGKPLPCAHWCLICRGIERETPLVPGEPLACASCPDCTPALAAADDATWD